MTHPEDLYGALFTAGIIFGVILTYLVFLILTNADE